MAYSSSVTFGELWLGMERPPVLPELSEGLLARVELVVTKPRPKLPSGADSIAGLVSGAMAGSAVAGTKLAASQASTSGVEIRSREQSLNARSSPRLMRRTRRAASRTSSQRLSERAAARRRFRCRAMRFEQAVAYPHLGQRAASVEHPVAVVGGCCHTEQGMANKPIAPSRGPRKVTVSGDLEGDYVVREQRDDGTLILKPETAVERARGEHGLEPASLAEFEAEYGAVRPPDGEG
jgi:hypothetical protein